MGKQLHCGGDPRNDFCPLCGDDLTYQRSEGTWKCPGCGYWQSDDETCGGAY